MFHTNPSCSSPSLPWVFFKNNLFIMDLEYLGSVALSIERVFVHPETSGHPSEENPAVLKLPFGLLSPK